MNPDLFGAMMMMDPSFMTMMSDPRGGTGVPTGYPPNILSSTGGGGIPWRPGYQPPQGGSSFDPNGMPFFGSMFDQQMWQGPYAAPLTGLQLDAMEGFGQFMNQNPILQQFDIQRAIQGATGSPLSFNLGRTDLNPFAQNFGSLFNQSPTTTDLTGATQPIQQTLNMAMPAFSAALNPQSFNTTPMFQAGEQVFQDDLSRTLADINEQFSSMGLDPGSTDRSDRLLRTAGNETARFRLGQQDIARQAFESQQGRGLQALSLTPALTSSAATFADVMRLPFEQQLAARGQTASMLPLQLQAAQIPFGEALQSEGLRANTELTGRANLASMLPTLMDIYNQPGQNLLQGFQLGGAAQGTADTAIARMMQEFGRTQGGYLNQMIALMSGIPLNEIGYGPSPLSQWASGLGGLAQGAGALWGSGMFDGGRGTPGVTPNWGNMPGWGIGGYPY